MLRLAAANFCGNAYASQFFAFSSQWLGVTKPAVRLKGKPSPCAGPSRGAEAAARLAVGTFSVNARRRRAMLAGDKACSRDFARHSVALHVAPPLLAL
jgi:hypothetical protein